MKLKKIIEEDLNHYKDYTLLLFAPNCSWKCCIEQDIPITECANYMYHKSPAIEYSNEEILDAFISNPLHSAVCLAGGEPLDSGDLIDFLTFFRKHNASLIIVYTGYNLEEYKVAQFTRLVLKNRLADVILKVGRYKKNDKSHFDHLLGIELASKNQYAIKIS